MLTVLSEKSDHRITQTSDRSLLFKRRLFVDKDWNEITQMEGQWQNIEAMCLNLEPGFPRLVSRFATFQLPYFEQIVKPMWLSLLI